MKTKLVHIVNEILPGGTEQGLLTLVKQGFYNAFDFRVVELYRGKGFMRDALANEIGEDRIISLKGERKQRSISTHPLARLIRRSRTAMRLSGLTLNLQGALQKLQPDTIVLSGDIPQLIGRTAALFSPDIKVVSFEHGTASSVFPLQQMLRLTSLRNDDIFGDAGETLRKRVASNYLGHKPEYLVPLTMLEPDTSHQVRKPETFKVLSVARLSPEKNLIALVEATAQLMKEGHRLELTIAGDGPQRRDLETTIARLDRDNPGIGIARNIKLPGFVSDKEKLHALRSAADIYIQPSLNEGFCLAAAEALAAGIPTIATDFAGAREYGTEKNMIRIGGFSRTDIAAAMRFMIKNYQEIAPAMSQAGIATTSEFYSRDPIWRQWEPAMQELMAKRRPRAPEATSQATYPAADSLR